MVLHDSQLPVPVVGPSASLAASLLEGTGLELGPAWSSAGGRHVRSWCDFVGEPSRLRTRL